MPQLVTQPSTSAGWVLTAGLIAILLLALWQAPLVVGGVLSLFALMVTGELRLTRNHFDRLAAERIDEDIGSFARQANCRENDTWIVRAVYQQVQNYLDSALKDFPLRWDDRFTEDLKIDDEELDDLIEEIAERTGRSITSTKANPFYDHVRTAGDLVRFLNAQPHRLSSSE